MNLLSDNIDPEDAEQIVDVLVENAHVIFTVMDFTDHIPLFALQHALRLLEVFHFSLFLSPPTHTARESFLAV